MPDLYITPTAKMIEGATVRAFLLWHDENHLLDTVMHWDKEEKCPGILPLPGTLGTWGHAPPSDWRLDPRRPEVQLFLTRWLASECLEWSAAEMGVPGPRFTRRYDSWFLVGHDVAHDFGDLAATITDPIAALVTISQNRGKR